MNIQLNLTKPSNVNFYKSNTITIELEQYIKGCVGQEVGNSDIEVCKAQAIAARTNIYQYVLKNATATDSSSSSQAFSADRIDNQNYKNVTAAVEATAGVILAYNNKPVSPASFSASNGGKTTSSEERWGGVRAWLISKDDPYDYARTKGKKTGHGVGMSQVGAKEMAAQGFTYQQILDFYYPNTTLMSISKGEESIMAVIETGPQKTIDWAMSKKGEGYVWGATGQVLTNNVITQLAERYPTHVNVNIVKKWLGKHVYDCASFTRLAMAEAGVSMPSGASTQWKTVKWVQKGTITSIPRDKVCCLYRESASANPMQHTGVYLGNGYVMDARGSATGVIYSKLGSFPWTHWAIPEGLYDNNNIVSDTEDNTQEVLKVAYQAKIVATSGNTVRLRAGTSTGAAVLAAVPVGSLVDVLEDGNEWCRLIYNNISGYMQKQFLEKTSTDVSKTWYVKVKCGSEADAKNIITTFQKLSSDATIASE